MTIFDVLAQQHRELEALFARVEALAGTTQAELAAARSAFHALSSKLISCMRAEHAVVYPRFADQAGLVEEVAQALREHEAIEHTINHLRLAKLAPFAWQIALEQLRRQVTEHAGMEEYVLFPIARLALTDAQAAKIGEDFVRFEARAADVSGPSITYDAAPATAPAPRARSITVEPGRFRI